MFVDTAQWAEGAIGTARYTGVSMGKVLKYCGGIKDGAHDVEFMGVDTCFKRGQVYNHVVSVLYGKVRGVGISMSRVVAIVSRSSVSISRGREGEAGGCVFVLPFTRSLEFDMEFMRRR